MTRTILAAHVLFLAAPALAAEPVVHRDLAYAEPRHERRTLDVYAPAGGKDRPVVVWIHGGGWQQGSKDEMHAKPRAFTEKGLVFVAINYRLVPHVTIRTMAGDVAKAIRWVHDHATEYGGDGERLFVMGHSAGAQLAALVCTDDRLLAAEGLKLSIVKGCVPVDGDTYDVPRQIATVAEREANGVASRVGWADSYRRKFGDAQSQRDLSPITHVAKGKHVPPFLILHVADHPETTLQSDLLAQALREASIPVKVFPAADTDHRQLNSNLGRPDDAPTKAVFDFVERSLKE